MSKFEADQQYRALLRLPCLFDPDVAALRECAAVLGRRVVLRRWDWSAGDVVVTERVVGVDAAPSAIGADGAGSVNVYSENGFSA